MSANAMLNIAKKAARDAGRFIAQSSDRLDATMIEKKGAHDYVTEIDKRAEMQIIDIIREAYPDHQILAEESSTALTEVSSTALDKKSASTMANAQSKSDYRWIIDPLDGTTNFIHGVPQFAVSIALEYRNKLEVAVIYDPIKQEEFTAARGQGAHLNGKRIRVSATKHMQDALLGTGIPFRADQEKFMEQYFAQAQSIAKESAGIRRAGAASLDLAYVAAGRLDGFWEYGLQLWDMAAGVLLIQEAGGLISDPKGGQEYLKQGNLVCANPKLFKPLLQLLNKA